jgi:hypothetical protein
MNPFLQIAVVGLIAIASLYQLKLWWRVLGERVRAWRADPNHRRWWTESLFCFSVAHVMLDIGLSTLCTTWALNIWVNGPRPATGLRYANLGAAAFLLCAKLMFIWATSLERENMSRFYRFMAIAGMWVLVIWGLSIATPR